MKKIFIIMVVILAVGGGAFFFYKKKSATSDNSNTSVQSQQDMQAQRAKMAEEQKAFFAENFIMMSKDDLVAGDKVTIMGTENSDGSVIATNVLVGDETQLAEIMSKMRNNMPQRNAVDSSDTNNRQFTAQMPSGGRTDFQNMTEEERTKMREKWGANGGNVGGQQRAGGQVAGGKRGGQARISGEIFSKDDAGITLKLSNGGSKLIFFSNDTQILKSK